MIRRLAVLALCTLAGCSGLRDALTAHQDVVARAAGQSLTVQRLAEVVGPAKSVPLRRDIMDRLAELWVDYQLLAQAAAQGDSLLDSATVLAANWPAVAQRLADRLHDTAIVSRATLAARQVDSAYNVGDYRWLHHILVSVRQDTTDEVRAAKRRLVEGYLARLRRGADFRRLATQRSEDPASAPNGGFLGLVGRGVMVRPFEEAAWALQPGGLSDVVESAFGYHIIWRPALELIRDSFAVDLKDLVIGRLDSLYLDSLSNRTEIRVRGSAPVIMRAAAQDPRGAKGRSRVLATYRGGRLRERDFARWLQAYPPQTRGMVLQAPDSTLLDFARSIARNAMLLRSAEQRGITLTPVDRDSIRDRHRRDLALVLNTIGVSSDSLAADTSAGRGDWVERAARRVDGYFAAIIGSPASRRYFEVSPFLADVLRGRFEWSISAAGIDRALERARELRGPEAPASPFPPMTPAPSGPPIGGARPGAPRP